MKKLAEEPHFNFRNQQYDQNYPGRSGTFRSVNGSCSKKSGHRWELVNRAGESLSSIVRSIDDLNTMVQQIASATEQMSATSNEISKDIESIANVSKETSASSKQTAHASVGLAKLSEKLQEVISKSSYEPSLPHRPLSAHSSCTRVSSRALTLWLCARSANGRLSSSMP